MSNFLVPLPDSPLSPSLVYRRGDYFRDAAATGRDFRWENLEDLLVTRSGDMATIEGADLITAALLRRLYTPPYGYRRWVRTAQGPRELDAEYGDEAYVLLSRPATAGIAERLRDAIYRCAAKDPRIQVGEVTVFPGQDGLFRLQLTYSIRGEEALHELDLVLRRPNQMSS